MHPNPAIISQEHRIIYIPLQKVACSSIKKSLFPLFGFGDEYGPHDAPFPNVDYATFQDRRRYFSFAFVRNPWDRLVSCYRNKIRQDKNFTNRWIINGVHIGFRKKYGDTFYAGMPFEEFVRAVYEIPDENADLHFRPQHCSLLIDGRIELDFLGRFENLEHDFYALCRKTKLSLTLPYMEGIVELKEPKKKVDYRDFFTTEISALVERRYQKDIELLGYTF